MERTINFSMTETQAKKFESLLDEFNGTIKRIEANEPTRQERMLKMTTEINLLLTQAENEMKRFGESKSNRPKMMWEK